MLLLQKLKALVRRIRINRALKHVLAKHGKTFKKLAE